MDRDTFSDWTERLFDEPMRKAAHLIEEACDGYLLKIYRDLDFHGRFQGPLTAADIAKQLGYTETADITLDAMLWRLAQHTHVVEAIDGDPVRYQGWQLAPDPTERLAAIQTELAALGEDYLAPLEFLAFGAEKFSYALGEDPEFMDRILSGREPVYAELWHRATNVDPLQDVHGIMGAEFIARNFEGGTILEIGGGTGNGTRNLLRRLAEEGGVGRIGTYVFTDISMRFIFETRKEIKADYPTLETDWKHVDINKPLTAQKIEPESVDLIFAINAAHVAQDLVGFLKECRVCLRPGGRVVFGERVRADPRMMAPRELALNLSIYHRTAAERNNDYRPVHCYLTRESWHRALDLAGFEQAETPPDPERLAAILPNAYAAVVTARKS
ncbi:MAG: L-histidine N(alpha)-methyltransferase [Geminicoccaceae bacterium]